MFEATPYLWQYLVQVFGMFIAYAFAGVLFYLILRRLHSRWITAALIIVFLGVSLAFYVPNGLPHAFEYPFFLKTYGPSAGPVIPFKNVWEFFKNFDRFERVQDIARDPNDIPPPINRAEPAVVEINLTAKEVIARWHRRYIQLLDI
jgi:ABC-type multidrug transport system fused ATPase/permease subunit